jgi:hypothetical protein
MGWVADLFRARVSGPIVILGAAAVIALIKLTYLLPEKYYFKFSTLVSSDASPFLVEPPGVTYARLCSIVQQRQIDDPKFAVNLHCPSVTEKSGGGKPSYGRQHESEIYRLAFVNDEKIRRALEAFVRTRGPQPPGQVEVGNALRNADNLETAVNLVAGLYHQAGAQHVGPLSIAQVAEALRTLPVQRADPGGASSQDRARPIDAKVSVAIFKTHEAVRSDMLLPSLQLQPITKKKIDDAIRYADSPENVAGSIAQYYSDQVAEAYSGRFKEGLRREGIDPERDRREVDGIVRAAGLPSYLLSIAIRLAPVILFGLAIGLIFGPAEINSAALAAGLAAFLLAWPVILMWDRVVSWSWQDKRALFLALYALYVLAFYLAARVAADLGALLRARFVAAAPEAAAGGVVAGEAVAVGFGRDLIVGLLVNAMFFIGNAIITGSG